MRNSAIRHSVLYEIKVKEFAHSLSSDMAVVTTDLPIREPTFWNGGRNYIVSDQWTEKGLFKTELIPIKGIATMHVHEFRKGICRLCGVVKE